MDLVADLPNSFYRVAACALIWNDTRDKFLIALREDGEWELPGGGWEFGETGPETVRREIEEEMGLSARVLRPQPDYLITTQIERGPRQGLWKMAAIFETELEHLNFNLSPDCQEIRFVNLNNLDTLPVFPRVRKLAELIAKHS